MNVYYSTAGPRYSELLVQQGAVYYYVALTTTTVYIIMLAIRGCIHYTSKKKKNPPYQSPTLLLVDTCMGGGRGKNGLGLTPKSDLPFLLSYDYRREKERDQKYPPFTYTHRL